MIATYVCHLQLQLIRMGCNNSQVNSPDDKRQMSPVVNNNNNNNNNNQNGDNGDDNDEECGSDFVYEMESDSDVVG